MSSSMFPLSLMHKVTHLHRYLIYLVYLTKVIIMLHCTANLTSSIFIIVLPGIKQLNQIIGNSSKAICKTVPRNERYVVL